MVLTIEYADPYILQREPGDGATFQNTLNTFFHRRNILRGYDPTHNLVDEFKTPTTGKGLNLKKDFTELTCPTGLFLMTTVALGGFADRLPVRNRRYARAHLKTVLFRHPLNRYTEMQFTGTPQDRLVCNRISLNSKAGVRGGQSRQYVRDLLFIAATTWGNGNPGHGFRQVQRL